MVRLKLIGSQLRKLKNALRQFYIVLVVDLVYEKKIVFVCLFSKWAKLKSRLESTTKQPKFKHDNVLVNKFISVDFYIKPKESSLLSFPPFLKKKKKKLSFPPKIIIIYRFIVSFLASISQISWDAGCDTWTINPKWVETYLVMMLLCDSCL